MCHVQELVLWVGVANDHELMVPMALLHHFPRDSCKMKAGQNLYSLLSGLAFVFLHLDIFDLNDHYYITVRQELSFGLAICYLSDK